MWSSAAGGGGQCCTTSAVLHDASTASEGGTPVHLVVVESPQDDATSEEYPWGITYRRLRRASAMIGASAVAIDNKIEQALDLVKNHLMLAVREEVELLKVQIEELTARNCRLEMENSILRSAASAETLAQLAASRSPLLPPT